MAGAERIEPEIRIDVVAVAEDLVELDRLPIGRIARLDREILAQRDAEAEAAADRLLPVDVGRGRVDLLGEKVDAERQPVVEEIRLAEREFDAARALAVGDGGARGLAAAEQVALADRDFGHEAVRRRIAARDRELAGRLFLDVDVDDHAIRGRARLVGDLHALEVVEILQPPLGAVDQHAIVGVAFRDIELAPDDIVARARVAADVDALDIGARALLDREHDVDLAGLEVAVAARADLAKA